MKRVRKMASSIGGSIGGFVLIFVAKIFAPPPQDFSDKMTIDYDDPLDDAEKGYQEDGPNDSPNHIQEEEEEVMGDEIV